MPRQATWSNSDGLIVGFGTHTVDNQVPAITSNIGAVKTASFVIQGTLLEDIGALTAASLYPQGFVIPRGSKIQRATLTPSEAFTSGGAATLTIGTVKWDAVGTVDDLDGIDATIAITAIDAIGESVLCDGALVNGTVVTSICGNVSNTDVRIVAGFGTAAFTAGKALLTIEFIVPSVGETVNN